MTEANSDNKTDPAALRDESDKHTGDNVGHATEAEHRPNRGLEDWEMVEQMSQSDGDLFAWFRTVVGAFVLGVIAFIVVAYGVYYFLFHYGNLFFTSHSGQ